MAKSWVVGLKKFFNRLNHDVLMARAVRQVREPRLLRLIRRFLEARMAS